MSKNKLDRIIKEKKRRKFSLETLKECYVVLICEKCPRELEYHLNNSDLFFIDYSLPGAGWSFIRDILRCPLCTKKFYKKHNI